MYVCTYITYQCFIRSPVKEGFPPSRQNKILNESMHLSQVLCKHYETYLNYLTICSPGETAKPVLEVIEIIHCHAPV